jgi:MoxR-like ATPase
MTTDIESKNVAIRRANVKFLKAREEISKVIVGQKVLVDSMLIALLADGHLLVEGVPGLAKTLAIKTLAQVTSLDFKRIQFTPDLLPADLTGTSVYNPKDGSFSVNKGPIFTNVVLADEINRAPAKVQSALLEVMQEKQATIGGKTFQTGSPFLVLATQNPIEQEGTYPLPEAQTDRFMLKVKVDYPTREEEKEIMHRMAKLGPIPTVSPILSGSEILEARKVVDSIYIDDKVTDYILNIVFATRYPKEFKVEIEGLLEFGASPRASLALELAGKARAFLEGRGYVTPSDIKEMAHAILRHRIRRSYEAEAEDLTTDQIIDRVLNTINVP